MYKPIVYIKKRIAMIQKTKKDEAQRKAFLFGEQDPIDIISYAGLEEQPDHLVIDGQYVRTLYIAGYPYTAHSGWLTMLINFTHNIDISYHIEQVEATIALPKLTRKITELESTRRAMMRDGKIIGSELTDPLDSAIQLKNKILRGQEKLFQVSIAVTILAKTKEELNKITTLLETALATKLFFSKTAIFQQIEGLDTVLPRGENRLNQRRNMDSSTAALTFPFVSSELVQETGILYGVNKSNNSLVILDRFSLHNANSIVFAQSGSGKSYATKVEILRQLMQGAHVIVIDPEREYKQLAESVKGTYIKLSTKSKEKISPFDTNSQKGKNKHDFSEHIQNLTELISLMAEGLTPEEKAVVDTAIIQTYKDVQRKQKAKHVNKKKMKEEPLFVDFFKTLKKMKQRKLATRLEKYATGSLKNLFDSQTNIKLNNRLVVFDIKDMNDSIRKLMMLTIATFVNTQVKDHPQKRLLVIDEGWMLLEHEESARFVAGLVRRARKYYLGVSIITQQANDFLKSDYGSAIASQSALRILMRQDTTTIKQVTQAFHLSEYEQKFLLTCEKGEALIIADQNHVAVKIIASEKEHPLITTNPAEVYLKA